MNRSEARKAAEVMLAYADGKKIEYKPVGIKGIQYWNTIDGDPVFNWHENSYRIKPGSKHRPFKDAEECWQEMQKHQPFGWVKTEAGEYRFIDRVTTEIHLADQEKSYSAFCGALESFTFADGEPFGVKEEA